MELAVFSGVLGFRFRGQGRRSLQYGVIPYFDEDASSICSKWWTNNFVAQPSISKAVIPVPPSRVPVYRGFAFPWGIESIGTYFSGTDEVCGFSRRFYKGGLLLLS